jgi:hypothetical protein
LEDFIYCPQLKAIRILIIKKAQPYGRAINGKIKGLNFTNAVLNET